MKNPEDLVVPLDQDHPGFRDKAYIQQRNLIAQKALDWIQARDEGNEGPFPTIEYRPEQHQVWEHIYTSILNLYSINAVHDVHEGLLKLKLNPRTIPTLEEVNQRLIPETDFRVVPVTGLVRSRYFFASLTRREFFCTQYIRHESKPDFTPEPDICHDVIGHVPLLMCPKIAQCYVEFAKAALVATDEEIKQLENLYWFTVEYGLVMEEGRVKTWGAGNLSSIADMTRSVDKKKVEHLPFEISAMLHQDYNPTIQQPKLFLADSLDIALQTISEYLNREFIQTDRPVRPLDG